MSSEYYGLDDSKEVQESAESEDIKAENILVKLMQKEPMKCIQWMVLQSGRECVAANATTFDISMSADIEGARYRITNKISVKKIKPNGKPE